MKILITGGVKSGKSKYALKLARDFSGKKVFIATAEAFDEEMKEKIKKHKRDRGDRFITIEEPVNLHEVLNNIDCDLAVVDCLTVWCGNLLHYGKTELIDAFIESYRKAKFNIITVTNEVGMGVVPENKLSRLYVEKLGFLNERIAEISDTVIFMVSGVPSIIKKIPQ